MIRAVALSVTPNATRATSTTRAPVTGQRKLRRALASVARRHAMTGPMPDSRTSISASGTV
jgi:hypothetical protein